ncbi:hypothetical protein DFS33DRAFT_1276289 [Desarmillaria ectypa]|nr:hypothetical protein DFS33DRAFT_1276289 [Desarmillaria ectypa]
MEAKPKGAYHAYVSVKLLENLLASRLRLATAVLAASTVFTAIFAIFACSKFLVSQAIRPKTKPLGGKAQIQDYSYLGHGHGYRQEWKIPDLSDSKAYVYVGNSAHYALGTKLGISEQGRLLPPGGGIVHLGPNQRPFSISMFHQLRCLNIVRGELMDSQKVVDSQLLQHCYLRQMILC